MKEREWKSLLTKKELDHLHTVAGVCDWEGLQRTIKDQAKRRKKNPMIEPCWICKGIARKIQSHK